MKSYKKKYVSLNNHSNVLHKLYIVIQHNMYSHKYDYSN